MTTAWLSVCGKSKRCAKIQVCEEGLVSARRHNLNALDNDCMHRIKCGRDSNSSPFSSPPGKGVRGGGLGGGGEGESPPPTINGVLTVLVNVFSFAETSLLQCSTCVHSVGILVPVCDTVQDRLFTA